MYGFTFGRFFTERTVVAKALSKSLKGHEKAEIMFVTSNTLVEYG